MVIAINVHLQNIKFFYSCFYAATILIIDKLINALPHDT